ncbi:MAG: hypothetical protein R3D98_13345 [Candidatus Krumholzibacteriia bacterium]
MSMTDGDRPFSFRTTKDGKVLIAWQGREVMVLKGKRAESLLQRLHELNDAKQQLALAKVTGNFKRGNERR